MVSGKVFKGHVTINYTFRGHNMKKYYKYLILGIMAATIIVLLMTMWKQYDTVEKFERTKPEHISMSMSKPVYYTESYAIAVGGGPSKYVSYIVVEYVIVFPADFSANPIM
jgi:hypothetical protein